MSLGGVNCCELIVMMTIMHHACISIHDDSATLPGETTVQVEGHEDDNMAVEVYDLYSLS